MVTMAKLIMAIHRMDMQKERVTTYHFRLSEQLGMVQVNRTTKGKAMRNKIHLKTYFTIPIFPSARANSISGGAVLIAGRQGIRTIDASSSSIVELLFAVFELTAFSTVFSLWVTVASAGRVAEGLRIEWGVEEC